MSALICPRCKADNPPERGFCQRCGYGLEDTGSFSGSSLADPSTWIGRTIGEKYEIVSVLGEGGFGIVFKVQMLLFDSDHNVFALKLLRPDLSRNDQFRRRFLREARTAMDLVHPYAIPVREFGQTEEGLLYFTMDYCRGEPLKTILSRQGYMTVNRAIPLVIQVLEVMEVAHGREIIHRDLKPENIFIERDTSGFEEVRVGDFGLAKTLNGSSYRSDITKGGIVGTPRYMSPEQSRGEALDHRSDLYSIGVLLFEMVTGQLPPRLHNGKKPPLPPGTESPALTGLREVIPPNLVVPRGVLEVLVRALEEKQAWRFQSSAEFREALQSLPTYTPTYIEPLPPKEPRFPFWLRTAVALLLVTVAVGLPFLFFEELRGWAQQVGKSLAWYDPATEGSPKPSAAEERTGPDSRVKAAPPLGEDLSSTPSDTQGPVAVETRPNSEGDGAQDRSRQNGEQAAQASPDGAPEPQPVNAPSEAGSEVDGTPTPTPATSPPVVPESVGLTASSFREELGELREWLPLHSGDRITYRILFHRDDDIDVQTKTYRIGDPDSRQRLPVFAAGDSDPERWWRVTDREATEVGSMGSGDELVEVETVWLKWDPETKRPETTWRSHDNQLSVRCGESVRTSRRLYEDCIMVEATKSTSRGVWTRRAYFKRSLGKVYLESRLDDVLVFSKERILSR